MNIPIREYWRLLNRYLVYQRCPALVITELLHFHVIPRYQRSDALSTHSLKDQYTLRRFM